MIIIDDMLYNTFKSKNAGSKARQDVIEILKKQKVIVVDQFRYLHYFNCYNFLRKLKKIDNSELIIIQYPLYNLDQKYMNDFLKILKKKNTILLIHDINSLRYYPKNKEKIKQEIDIINKFKVVISHNENMTEWLHKQGVVSKIINLDLFDYLGKQTVLPIPKYDVCYAGNLNKSVFLYDMIKENKNVTFELFGIGFEQGKIDSSNFIYEGNKQPEELLNSISSKYGLVWDGDSIMTCHCNYGEYLRYNNPHKLSLYIAARIPVIVWKQSAIANFVNKNKIGLALEKLDNLEEELNKITDEEYQEMLDNVIELSKKVSNGYFVKRALEEGEKYL